MAYETAVLMQLGARTAKHLIRMGGFSPRSANRLRVRQLTIDGSELVMLNFAEPYRVI